MKGRSNSSSMKIREQVAMKLDLDVLLLRPKFQC
jgi:hypothetical protein